MTERLKLLPIHRRGKSESAFIEISLDSFDGDEAKEVGQLILNTADNTWHLQLQHWFNRIVRGTHKEDQPRFPRSLVETDADKITLWERFRRFVEAVDKCGVGDDIDAVYLGIWFLLEDADGRKPDQGDAYEAFRPQTADDALNVLDENDLLKLVNAERFGAEDDAEGDTLVGAGSGAPPSYSA